MKEKEELFFNFNRFYVVDCQTTLNYEELKKDLINEIKRDTLENKENENIVKSNMDLLEKVIKADIFQESFIIEELKKFGAMIFKVNELVDNLTDLKNYYKNNDISNGNNELIKNIDTVLKDIYNYFSD